VAAEPETSFHAHIYAKGEARLELFLEEKVAVSAVSSAFRGVLACEPGPITAIWDDDSYTWRYSATCACAFPRQGLARTGRVNLQPVFDSLRQLRISSVALLVSHPQAGFTSAAPGGWSASTRDGDAEYTLVAGTLAHPPFEIFWGYRLEDYPRVFAPMALLLIPIALTLWMRRAAMRLAAVDATAAWYSYARFLNHVIWVGWIGWIALGIGERFAALGELMVIVAVFLLPPAALYIVTMTLSWPVLARVRGMEWSRARYSGNPCGKAVPWSFLACWQA